MNETSIAQKYGYVAKKKVVYSETHFLPISTLVTESSCQSGTVDFVIHLYTAIPLYTNTQYNKLGYNDTLTAMKPSVKR